MSSGSAYFAMVLLGLTVILKKDPTHFYEQESHEPCVHISELDIRIILKYMLQMLFALFWNYSVPQYSYIMR